MLKRPSSRRKSAPEPIQLNLVPILDAMVTLIGFLLYTSTFIALVSIESPFPLGSSREIMEKLKERPLQLTLTLGEESSEIWSPFERIPAEKIPHLSAGQPNLKRIHEILIRIKQKFLKETKIVLIPLPGITYDILIATMDQVRQMEPSDPTIYRKNPLTGNDEPLKNLFPEVIFGNLLGGS